MGTRVVISPEPKHSEFPKFDSSGDPLP
jgi:hypothetical protein